MKSKDMLRMKYGLFTVLSVVFVCLAASLPGTAAVSAHHLSPDSLTGIGTVGSQQEGVVITADSSMTLDSSDALAPPAGTRSHQQYGFYTSPIQTLQAPSARLALSYHAAQPAGSTVLVDVRASADGQQWTAWETGLASDATIDLPFAATMVQYRARLFGSLLTSPTLSSVQIEGVAGFAPATAPAAEPETEAIAPTFRVWATRQGMIGGRTANGHIIKPRDHFVSLPSWSSLASRNGYEYQVRITYNGRSATAPVWDVGPWNTRDDYWSVERELYKDLPQGWPQDHAAYYDGHNGGYAQYGYVRFPTAIDVGDGVWWDALGIRGDRAEVEVTFLWMGKDPLAGEAPSLDPNASEYMVDELGPAFHQYEATWHRSSVGCGEGKHAFWTTTVQDEEQVTNEAFWQPRLPADGMYDIYVHVPICPSSEPRTETARYLVQHRDRAEEFAVNQATQTGWVLLGRFPFEAGNDGFVYLTNLAGDEGRTVWFDNVRWVPVRE
jgi:hypothetical protein